MTDILSDADNGHGTRTMLSHENPRTSSVYNTNLGDHQPVLISNFFNYPRLILNTKENNYQLFLTENRVERIEIDVWRRL